MSVEGSELTPEAAATLMGLLKAGWEVRMRVSVDALGRGNFSQALIAAFEVEIEHTATRIEGTAAGATLDAAFALLKQGLGKAALLIQVRE